MIKKKEDVIRTTIRVPRPLWVRFRVDALKQGITRAGSILLCFSKMRSETGRKSNESLQTRRNVSV